MEESISGFKKEGGWIAIVEHGERMSKALADEGVTGGDFDEWNEWRPKAEERYRTDIKNKTAEVMSTDEGASEKAGREPEEDLDQAREEFIDALEELRELDLDDTMNESGESVEYAARAADSTGRRALRTIEGTVYRRVMTSISPCYFDNELVSANIQRANGEDPRYVFEVNVNDDDLKAAVRERCAVYDEEISRWHVDAEKDMGNLVAAEGADPAELE